MLTGASGFLGTAIYDSLVSKGYLVTTLGRSQADILCDLGKHIPDLPHSFDFVVHVAGKAHSVPKTQAESEAFYEVNVTGTSNLLLALGLCKPLPQSMVYISSVAVYGLSTGTNVDERAPLLAADPYGKSKIESEQLIEQFGKENHLHTCILRLPLIAGKNPPGNLGFMIRAIRKGFYFSFGNGNVRKSMVLATDVAALIPELFGTTGTYNLTDGNHPRFEEVEQAILTGLNHKGTVRKIPAFLVKWMAWCGDLLGSKAPINSVKLKKMQSELTFSDQKARTELHWNPGIVTKQIKNWM